MSTTPVTPSSSTPVTVKSTTPVTSNSAAATPKPNPTLLQDIETDIATAKKEIGLWLDPAHILLLLLLIGATLTGVYFFESKRAEVAEAKAEVATEVLKVAQDAAASSAIQNAAQQAQTKAVEEAMQAANQQLITANQQLQTANQQLTTKLLAQQKTDAALPPQGQALRWEALVPTAKVTVTSTGFAVDAPSGLATIQALEELPTDRATIANLTTEVNNDKQTIVNDAVSLNSERTAHASDNANNQKTIAADEDKNKKLLDDYNAYKHKARRNVIRAFFIGVVVGIVGAHAAGI